MIRVLAGAILALGINTVTPAVADDCAAALIVSTYKDNSESSRDYRMSQFVSREQYETLKKGGAGRAVIYGVPVGGSYEQYQAQARKLIDSVSQSLSEHQMRNVLWTGLDSTSLQAYESCLIASKYGLFFYVRAATKSAVEIVVKYRPTSNSGEIALSWSGATTEIRAAMPQKIGSGSASRIVSRPNGDDLLLAINVVGDGPEAPPAIRITSWPGEPPPQPVAPCDKLNDKGQCVRCGGTLAATGVTSGGSIPFTCPNTVPNQPYLTRVSGQVIPRGDPNVGSFVVLEMLGREGKAFSPRARSGFSNKSSAAAMAFTFNSPMPVTTGGSFVDGAFVVEGCTVGGPVTCDITADSRWQICMAGSAC